MTTPKDFITIEMLPAGHGDGLLLRYGKKGHAPARMLIDGGPYYTYDNLMRRLLQLPADDRVFEALVITHIDADHIDGVIRLLQEDLPSLGIQFNDVWFNGTEQMNQVMGADALGAKQGEYLQALITKKGLAWNRVFDGGPILARPDRPVTLPSGAKVRVLSPNKVKLVALLENWSSVIADEGYTTGDVDEALKRLAKDKRLRPFDEKLDLLGDGEERTDDTPDRSLANGSSIAFVLEVGRRKVLLAGDAHHDVLVTSLDHFPGPGKRLKIQALKLAHHGSIANLSTALLDRLDCTNFLISTNGSYFDHPDNMCIETIIEAVDGANLWFNYATEKTTRWLDEDHGQDATVHLPEGITFR